MKEEASKTSGIGGGVWREEGTPGRWRPWPQLLLAALLAVSLTGCDPTTKTEDLMLKWGGVLNIEVATGLGNEFPRSLSDLEPELRGDLAMSDGWGNTLVYERLGPDRFRMVSGGPDGSLGNDDDVVMINNRFVEAAKEYSSRPLKK